PPAVHGSSGGRAGERTGTVGREPLRTREYRRQRDGLGIKTMPPQRLAFCTLDRLGLPSSKSPARSGCQQDVRRPPPPAAALGPSKTSGHRRLGCPSPPEVCSITP